MFKLQGSTFDVQCSRFALNALELTRIALISRIGSAEPLSASSNHRMETESWRDRIMKTVQRRPFMILSRHDSVACLFPPASPLLGSLVRPFSPVQQLMAKKSVPFSVGEELKCGRCGGSGRSPAGATRSTSEIRFRAESLWPSLARPATGANPKWAHC